MDEYKKFANGGEIVYPGIFDSLKVIPGNKRVLITGNMISDPKVTRYRIYWNDKSDSLDAPFVRSGVGIDTMKQIVPDLPEGPISLEVRSMDEAGNQSVPMYITGSVYGENFQQSIDLRGNRQVLSAKMKSDGSVELTWEDVQDYVGNVGMRIHYIDAENKPRDTTVGNSSPNQVTILPSAAIDQPISYSTLYLPDMVGIDSMSVAEATLPLISEVELLNNVQPFKALTSDGGRWGTLLDWISNDAALSHSGNGGIDMNNNNKMYFEAGWGSPAIHNGKVYQVVTLPAGNYTLKANMDWYNQGGGNQTYMVVAKGINGLPDVDNVSTAFAYKRIETSWTDVSLNFTLTEKTTLSIGLAITMGEEGNLSTFNSIRLMINH